MRLARFAVMESHGEQPHPDSGERAVVPDAEHLLSVVRALVAELHAGGSVPHVTMGSVLDRDLGLDSVSRAELLSRLERAFDVRVAEAAVLRAVRVLDLLREVYSAQGGPAPTGELLEDLLVPRESTGLLRAEHETLTDALEWHARRHPERAHAYLLDTHTVEEVLSYGELFERARTLAAGLLEHGVEPGDRVALMLPTGAEYLCCFCATLLIGATPVPLYPPSRLALLEEHLDRQRRILDNAQAVLLISVREALPLARGMRRSLPALRSIVTASDLSNSGVLPSLPRRHADDLALVQYTSGSTGDPKGVMLSHRNLLSNIRAMGDALEVGDDDVMVSWLPLYHDMGLIGCWLSALYYGFPVVLMSPLTFLASPSRWLRAIQKARATLACAPNFAYELCVRRLADSDLEGLDLSSWRFALNGSEPVSPQTIEAFCQRFEPYGFVPGAMFPAYGLAECSVALTFPPPMRGPRVDRVFRDTILRHGRAVPASSNFPGSEVTSFVSCGSPLAGHEVRIVDKSGRVCPDRTVGEIEFRGPSATQGYLARPEETRKLFHDTWLRTGDLGYLADGELYPTGRTKDIIIRAGQHLYPQEIEEAVGNVPGVRKGCVAAFGTLDPQARTERLIVVAETRETDPAAQAALVAQINALGASRLGAPPEDVVLVPPYSVPKTPSGKLRRDACRKAYEEGRLGRAAQSSALQLFRIRVSGLALQLRRSLPKMALFSYGLYAWLSFTLLAVVAWLLVLVLPQLRWRVAVARVAARLLSLLTLTRISVSGREHLPRGPCVIVCNHQSSIDAFVLYGVLPVTFTMIAKAELSESWWTRIPLDRLDAEYVRREVPMRALVDARRIAARTRTGNVPLFFAEGTHSRIPGLLPFRMGAFLTATEAGLPIVPVVIEGTRAILRSGTLMPRRGAIRVTIGQPIFPVGKGWDAAILLKQAARGFMLAHTKERDLG